MVNLFVMVGDEIKPIDITKITDESDFSEDELKPGLRKAVIDTEEVIKPEVLVIKGNPVGITASHLRPGYGGGQPSGSEFDGEILLHNLEGITGRYDPDSIFVIGNFSYDTSYYMARVFPIVPFKIDSSRQFQNGYHPVDRALFRYENERPGLVPVSPLEGESTPQCIITLGKEAKVLTPDDMDDPKTLLSTGRSGVPYTSEERHLRRMLPAEEGVAYDVSDFVMLEKPGIFSGYGRDYSHNQGRSLEDVRRNNRIQMFLQFASQGLRRDSQREVDQRMPLENIARVIGDVRGDSCCTFFSYVTLGYRPREI